MFCLNFYITGKGVMYIVCVKQKINHRKLFQSMSHELPSPFRISIFALVISITLLVLKLLSIYDYITFKESKICFLIINMILMILVANIFALDILFCYTPLCCKITRKIFLFPVKDSEYSQNYLTEQLTSFKLFFLMFFYDFSLVLGAE